MENHELRIIKELGIEDGATLTVDIEDIKTRLPSKERYPEEELYGFRAGREAETEANLVEIIYSHFIHYMHI